MRGAIGSQPAGMAIVTAAVLGLAPVSVRADEPGTEPSPSPTSTPTLSPSAPPSGSPIAEPSLTTSQPTPVTTVSGAPPKESNEQPDVVGIEGAVLPQVPLGQAGSTVSVAAVDDAFRPPTVTVTVGTAVVWTNQGQNPHTVTANDRAFDSGTLESGGTFSVTFDRVGEVPYYCQIHGEPGSGMRGLVIVQAAPSEEEGEQPPVDGSDDLSATGTDPGPLAIAVLALAFAGLVALRAARRADGRR